MSSYSEQQAPPVRAGFRESVIQASAEVGDGWRAEAEGSLALQTAVTLTWGVGFYVFSIVAGVFFIALPFIADLHHIKLVLMSEAFGFSLIAALAPRFDRFVPPGPELTEAEQPALFRIIREVAQEVDERMPDHVYLLLDVNAFVTHRGGLMGFGSRRVMGIGLPLMQALTVPELKAVIAHEFGHFKGGDTRLGPLIYRMREALGRAASREGVLQKVFAWYAEQFMKLSMSISRRQEYNADAVAAQCVGANVAVEALRKVDGASEAFNHFWEDEYTPVLNQGFRGPLADGFCTYLNSEFVREAVDRINLDAEADSKEHPFSTHPPTGYRLAALMRFATQPYDSGHAPLAARLLNNLVRIEGQLLETLENQSYARMKLISWEQMATQVYLPAWREDMKEKDHLKTLTLADVPKQVANLETLAASIKWPAAVPKEQRLGQLKRDLIKCSMLAFAKQGWEITRLPGQQPAVSYRGATLTVVQLEELAADESAWQGLLKEKGFRNEPFGEVLEKTSRTVQADEDVDPFPEMTTSPSPLLARVRPGARLIMVGILTFTAAGIYIGVMEKELLLAGLSLLVSVVAGLGVLGYELIRHKNHVGTIRVERKGFSLIREGKTQTILYDDILHFFIHSNFHQSLNGTLQGMHYSLYGKTKQGAFALSHYDQRPACFFREIQGMILFTHGLFLKERIEKETISTSVWSANKTHLTYGGKSVAWADLVAPSWVGDVLYFWEASGKKPVFKMKIKDQLNQLVVIAAAKVGRGTFDAPEGGWVGSTRSSLDGLLMVLFGVLTLSGVLVVLNVPPEHGFVFGLVTGAFAALTLWFWYNRLHVFTNCLQKGRHKMMYDDIQELKWQETVESKVVIRDLLVKDGQGRKLKLRIKGDCPSIELAKEWVVERIGTRLLNQIHENGSVEWVEKVFLTKDHVFFEGGNSSLEIPYEDCEYTIQEGCILHPPNI